MMKKLLQITLCLLLITGLQLEIYGQALDLDGTDDRFTVSDNNDFDYSGTNLTFEAWIKPTSSSSNASAIIQKDRNGSNGTGYMFYILNNQLGFAINNNINNLNTVGNGTLTIDTWNHVALTYDGSTAIMYINGVLDKSTSLSLSGGFVNSSAPLVIGEFTAPSNYLEAEIDEIRMWNDIRTITEIKDNMHKQLTPANETNLIAYYQLDHTDGTTSITESKNGYTGTWEGSSGSNTTSDFTTSYAAFGNSTMNNKTDVRGLWQITGTNVTSESDGLTMQINSALTETNYAVFGHDNAGTTTTSNDMSTSAGVSRYSQTWYVDETGTVSGATVTFDLSTIYGNSVEASTASNYVLLYRSGTSGDFSDVTTGSSIANTDQVSFTSVDLQDGYYTIGTINNISSSLTAATNALDFDGSDDYINLGDLNGMEGISTFTMECWVNLRTFSSYQRIFSKVNSSTNGWSLLTGSSQTNIAIGVRNGANNVAETANILTANTWTHIAFVFDGTATGNSNRTKLYVNGEEVTLTYIAGSAPTTTSSNSENLTIGGIAGLSRTLDGEMDEVRFWTTARTESEIRTNRYHKLNGDETGLLVYYSFDNVTTTNGTTGEIVDLTSNSNHGTTVNMTNDDIISSTASVVTGTTTAATNHQNQSQTVNNVTVDDTNDAFDNTQDVSVTEVNEEPNTTSGISEANIEPKFYFINIYANGGAAGTFNVSLTMFTDFPNGSVVVLYKRDDSSTGSWSIVGAATVVNGKVTYAGITSFSQFILASSASLPVELVDFNAHKINQTVSLTWQTASEKNNHGFEIERSQNGKDWENIGFLAGNGTTTDLSNYQFIDERPFNDINYYRLKQVDFDGQFDYSNIVSINLETGNQQNDLKVFPNPVSNQLNIVGGEGLATIYNMLGQPVKQLRINNEQFTINTTDLSQGQYMLQIQRQNGHIIVKQFVK